MGRRKYLGCVCVETAVVNGEAEGDGAVEAEILGAGADAGIGEEEYHWWVMSVERKGVHEVESWGKTYW